MSLASKLTFGACCLASVGIIGYVHFKQVDDRNKLKSGVLRDVELQHMKKAQNLYDLEHQKSLEQVYREAEERGKSLANATVNSNSTM